MITRRALLLGGTALAAAAVLPAVSEGVPGGYEFPYFGTEYRLDGLIRLCRVKAPDGCFPTIDAALDVAEPGDIIFVSPGYLDCPGGALAVVTKNSVISIPFHGLPAD